MGSNLARNLARNGFATAVHNRSPHRAQKLVSAYGAEGTLIACEDLAAVVAVLPRPRRIILMVPAGDPTDAVLNELVPLLSPGDIVVDGGNAHFTDTKRRESALTHRGIHFVGAGISGGEEGALRDPAIMVGGSETAYVSIAPLLEKIAAKVDGRSCCTRIGSGGAGHWSSRGARCRPLQRDLGEPPRLRAPYDLPRRNDPATR
jgi:6-phosphogluconate dehydrogenase